MSRESRDALDGAVMCPVLERYDVLAIGAHLDDIEVIMGRHHYVGSLMGARFAEVFKARSPLLLDDPTVVAPVRLG